MITHCQPPNPSAPSLQRDNAIDSSANGRLLVALYPATPTGIEPLIRYPTPIRRQLLIDATRDELAATILALLHEGGPHSYVHVESVPTDPLVA